MAESVWTVGAVCTRTSRVTGCRRPSGRRTWELPTASRSHLPLTLPVTLAKTPSGYPTSPAAALFDLQEVGAVVVPSLLLIARDPRIRIETSPTCWKSQSGQPSALSPTLSVRGTSIASGRGVETSTTCEPTHPSDCLFNATSTSNRCWQYWRRQAIQTLRRRLRSELIATPRFGFTGLAGRSLANSHEYWLVVNRRRTNNS